MKKNSMRLLSFLLATLMVIAMFPAGVFAEDTSNGAGVTVENSPGSASDSKAETKETPTVSEGMDFTAAAGDLSGEGWAWSHDTKTLTLSGVSVQTNIVLPDGATLVAADGTENDVAVAEGNAIYVDGSLTVSGKGKLSVESGFEVDNARAILATASITVKDTELSAKAECAVAAPSVSITDSKVDLYGYYYGIHAKTTTGEADSVVTLNNVSGKIAGYGYGGINAHSETANISVTLTGCKDLEIANEYNADSTGVNFNYAGIRAYTRGSGKDVSVVLENCENVSVSNSTMAIVAACNANAANPAAANALVKIANSTGIVLEGRTSCYSAVFVNNYGLEDDDSAQLVIDGSDVQVLAPNATGLMTSSIDAPSTIAVDNSSVEITAKQVGMRNIASKAEDASVADTSVVGSTITYTTIPATNFVDKSVKTGVTPVEVYYDESSTISAPISGTITSDVVWKDGDIVGNVTIAGNVTITVKGTVTVNGTIRLSPDAISDVVFNGSDNAKLIRGAGVTGQMFYCEGLSANFHGMTFNSVTLDGGAVWTGDLDATLGRGTTNSGVKATGSVLYLLYTNVTLNNSVLQNHDDSTGEKANAVFLRYYSTISFNSSVVRYNNSPSTYYRGGVITVRQGGTVKTDNADVYGNSGAAGGFFGISSTGSYGGIAEVKNSKFHNNYADNGAVFLMQCNSNKGYLSIDGCEFYENASKTAVLTEWAYSRPFIIKDSYFHDNECAIWDCHADPVLDLSGKIVIEGDDNYDKYLFETPLVLTGPLSEGSSIEISEASVAKLMKTGYVLTGTQDYTVTADDLAKLSFPEGYDLFLVDVNGDGIADVVAIMPDEENPAEDITLTLKDGDNEASATVNSGIVCLPANPFSHEGLTFAGWVDADGNPVAKQQFTETATLYATWKVNTPVVKLSRDDATLKATVTNATEGVTYTYQWYKGGVAIEGATSDSYTMTDVNSASYKCEVTASFEGAATTVGSASGTSSAPAAAQVGDVKYLTFKEAITAANAIEGGATVTLLADVTLGEKLTITGNVTISGAFTITRGDAYTGTLFAVEAGATLTLDGGLTIDGGNAWTYTVFPPIMDMNNGAGTYVANHITPAEGGVDATAHMIVNNGTLNVHSVTIENSYSTGGFSIINAGASSVTTLNGATICHNAANRSGAIAYIGGNDAVLTIKGTTRITDNFGIGNGGIIQNYGQGTTVNFEGGSIDNNFVGKSGTLYASYSSNANKINTFNMTGGIITKNVMEGYGPVYIHTNTVWNMTGGEISENISFLPSYVRNNNPAGSMTGGKIVNNEITGLDYSNGYYVTHPDLRLNGKTAITGGTYTQDVSEYLAPDVGLTYDAASGTYTTTEDIFEYNGQLYKSLAEVIAAIKAAPVALSAEAPVVKLVASTKVDETLIIDVDMVLNLNGKTIYADTSLTSTPVIRVVADVTVTGNGKIDGRPGTSSYAFIVGQGENAGNLTIENGTFYGSVTAVSVTKGTATINGGNFAVDPYVVEGQEDNYNFLLNCIDPSYKDGTAKIFVKGGTFYKFNPADNAAEGAGTSFVAENYLAEADGDYYTVRVNKDTLPTVADVVITLEGGQTITLTYPSERFDTIQKLIGTNDYADFVMGAEQSELLAYVANGNVTEIVMNLYDDIALDAPINFYNKYFQVSATYDITINGNNNTITWADGYNGTLINVESGVGVTLNKLNIFGDNTFSFYDDTTTVEDGQNWYTRFVDVGEEDKAINANVIVNAGDLTLNRVTIAGVTIASDGDNGKTANTETGGYYLMYNDDLAIIKSNGGTVALNDSRIDNNAGLILNAINAKTEINGTGITNNMGAGNKGGIIVANGGTMSITDATINNNKAMARSATILGVTGGAEVSFNGLSTMDNNKHIGVGSNTAGAMIVLEGASQFVMNGGSISNNIGGRAGAIASRWVGGSYGQHEDTSIVLNAGTIKGNTASNDSWNGADIFLRSPATIGAGMKVDGTIAVNAAPGELDITGGTFTNFELIVTDGLSAEITGGTFDSDPSEWLADGYVAPKNDDGTYTARVQSYVEWVKEQLLAGNDVTLTEDIVITDYDLVNAIPLPSNGNGRYNEAHGNGAVFHIIKPGVELDLNGHSITWDAHDDAYCNKRQVSLFMVTATGVAGETADFTIKDSVGTGKVDVYGMGSGVYVVLKTAKATVAGGTWTNYPCKTCGASNIFLYPSHGGTLEITGGTFEQKNGEYLLACFGSTKETNDNGVGVDYDSTRIIISGGTFVGFNPENVKFIDFANGGAESEINGCELGLMAKDNGDGTYGIQEWDLVVRNTEDLVRFATMVNTGNTFAGKTVKLGADINLAGLNWTPIGNDTNYFCGTFDGQDHTISNMTINVNTPDKNQFVGLFGGVKKATIKNLTMTDVKIDVVGAKVRAAAVVGIAHSNSENRTDAAINFENITVNGCTINAEAKAGSALIGGVVGYCYPANLANINVSDLTIDAKAEGNEVRAAAILGYLCGQNISNNGNTRAAMLVDTFNVENVSITANAYTVFAGGFAPYTYYGYITIEDGTIDGLKIDVDAYEAFVGGLVGYFWRSDNGHNVKNVHITDIDFDVTTGYKGETRVGGMVGTSQSPNTKYTDCSVSGKIVERCSDPANPVNFHAKVGGFVARTYEYAQQTYTNCVADVDITASNIAGGFVGNHNSTVSYVNCVAKGDVTANIAGGFAGRLTEHGYTTDVTFQGCESHGNVTGTSVAGGFIGSTADHGWADWAAGNGTPYGKNVTIKDCTVTGTVTSGTDYRAGVVGEAKVADGKYLSLVNVSYVVEPPCYPYSESIKNYVIELTDAEGNKILYAELADAIADAQSGDTITLLDNVSLTAPVTVPAGKAITLDLGDYTLSYTSDVAGEAMITNNGELTVVGEGAIVYTYTGAADSAYTKGNYTINNSGKLVIDGATVQNATAAMSHAYYAVNNGNGGEVILKSGLIENLTNYGVRLFGKGSLTVNGGEIKGTRAVWIQAPGSNTADAPAISLTVNDGKLTATGENGGYKLAVYSYNYGNSPANINITVTGGVIDGDIALTGGVNKTATETVTVTGGIINDIYSYAEDEVAKNTVNVSGGTFNVRVYDAYLADGFIPTENDDGTYSVVEGKYVAMIDGVTYGIVDALKHWTDGKTMTLIADVTLPDVIKLSSTEKHILNLGSFTMTAASGKDAIQIVNNSRSNAGFALEINADATNPGGITAKGKAIVRTTGKSNVKDRPIIVFNGGVFNASNIVNHSGSSGTNCPQFRFYGGEYTGTISANRAMFWFYGGKFNSSLFISVDSSAYALIAGGEFKELRNWYGSALNANKFTIGSAKGVFDREVYINDDGYYVVVPTLPAGIQAAATITTGTNDYLYYSKIGAKGLMYYTDVNVALSANNKTSGEVFVYVDTIDLSALNYKGTMVITDSLTVTYNEGTTPAWTVKAADAGKFVYVKETVANGVVTAVYTVGEMPVAKIGTQFFATLAEAIDAAQSGDTIILVADVTENVTVDENLTIDGGSFEYTGTMTLTKVNVTIQNVDFVKGNVYKHKSTGIGGNYVIKNCTFDGQNSVNYAIDLGGTTTITVENCTAKNYSYGFLQVPATNNSVTVKDVTVSDVNYGVKIDYSNGVTLENVNITAKVAGVLNSTYGAKTITIKNSTINNIVTWVRNVTFQQTVVFEGANTVGDLSETDLTTLKLADGATLTAPEGLTVITDKADHKVVYENGTYKIVAKVYVAEVNGVKYESLQAAIDACVVGNNTITLLGDTDEDVTIKQVEGVNVTIDGASKTYSGTITIHGNARYTGAETLTIKNVKFVTDEAGHYFIDSNSTGSVERYAHNVTVEGCLFVAEGAAINSAAAVRIRQGFNIKLVKNLSENLHSLFQGYGCAGFSAEANRVTGKNGISVGTSTGVQIIANEIVATGYGVRADGTSESDMFFEDNTITAELPLVIRNVTGSYELTMGRKSTLNASNADGYQIVFTQGDDGTYIDCTGYFTLIKDAAHEYEVYPFDAYVAFVGDRGYVSLQDAINACKNGETVKLVADITYDADDIVFAHGGATGFGNYDHYNPSIIYVGGTKGETPAQNLPSDVNVVIDLNGHTITNNADAYLFLFMDNCQVTFTDSLGDGKIISHSTSYPSIWACGTDTLVTIEKGYYETDSALGLLHATHAGDLVIYGGEFKTTAEDASLLIMLNSQKYNNPNYFLKGVATVTIYGGIFHGFNPNYVGDDYGASSIEDIKFVDGCAENYEPVDNGDGTYGVVPTKLIKVEVEMIPGAWGTNYITVENWADLVAALGEYTNLPIKITLLEDVVLPETLVIKGNKSVVIDLNGKTLKGMLENHADLTVNDTVGGGKIDGGNEAAIDNYGVLTVNGGSFSGDVSAIYNNEITDGQAEVTIYGGEFTAPGDYCATIENRYGILTVNGGKIVATNPAGYAIVDTYGKTTVNGGEIVSAQGIALETYGGKIVITDGTLVGKVIVENQAGNVTVYGGTLVSNTPEYYYGMTNASGGVTVLYGGTYERDYATAEGTTTRIADGYKAVANTDGTFTVKRIITVKFDDATMTYGDELPKFTYTTNFTEIAQDGEMLVVNQPVISGTNVGTYEIKADAYVFMSDKYTYEIIPGTLTIEKAKVTVKFDDVTVVHGNELPKFTYTTNFTEIAQDGEMLIVPTPVINVTGAGTYVIDADAYVFMSNNYDVEVIPGTLTVQKAALSVDGVFFTDLDSAIPSIKRNSVIKLYDDIEYGKTVVDGSNKFVEFKLKPNLGDLVIDLNGHNLTFHFAATIQYGTTLTIKDSSGVPGTIRNTNGAYPFVINPQTVVNLVDGVNFDCTIQMNCTNNLSGYFRIDGKNIIGETDSLFVAGNSYIRLALKQNYLYVETIAGTLTLAEDWKTLAGQTVVIGGSTGITVAEGVTLTIDPTTQLTIKGYLNGEGTVVVNTLEHFEQIMATDIKNIEIGSTIVLSEDYVLDLAGKKITSSEGVNPAFRVTDGAKVTVKNADMDTAGYAFILGASDGSSAGYLTIENGKFHSVTTVVSVTNGKLTVLDGEFSVTPYNGNYAYLLNCIDANYNNGTASIEISGGIFHNWDPEDNAAEGKNTNFVADRHASVEIDENVWKVVDVIDVTVTLDDKTMVIGNAQPEYTYSLSDATLADVIKVTFNAINVTAVGTYDITATVEADSLYNVTVVDATLTVVDAVAQIGSVNFASLRDALNAAEDGNTIVILKDHAMDGTDVVNDTVYGYDNLAILNGTAVTLDFNGHTISVQPDCDANDDNALENCLESIIFVANGGSLTVTDTVGNGGFYVTKGTNLYCLIYNSEGSTVTVKNGNFYVEETVQNGAVIYADGNNTTSIEGGNFTLVNAGSYDNTKPWITNVEGKNEGNFVQVTGGTFNQDPYLNRFTAKDWEVNVPENFAIVNNGNGTWSVVPAVVYIEEDYIPGYKTGYATLADALAAVENGETIVFVKDFSENVTIKQTEDLSFTINGNDKIFGGTITIDGAGRYAGEETLTITNVNFLAETDGQSSIITKKSSYAHNVTIDGCTFTGTDAKNAYGINLQHAYDITVKNVTGTKLYDLVYGKFAVTGFVAENVTVTETGTGFWFTSVKNASFKNVDVKAENAIGVKNAMSSTMTFENCSFEAEIPVYMWLSTADVSYAMVFNGTNSMVATKGGSWLVINETKSAGFKVTLNDTGLDAAGIDTVVAMIGDNVYYNSVAYAVKDAQDGETVVVIADDTSAKDIIANNNVTLDLNGFDVTGNLTVNGNLTIKDSTVDEAAKNYDDAGHLNGTVTVADGATLTLYAGIYNQNVDEYCADHYLARDNKNGTWTVCRGVVFNKTYGTSFLTIADAMANAMTTAGRDHIVLLEDHFENIVIVYDNTILDLGTFDLTTNYVIVFKGGNLTGNTYSSTNDYGKLIVAQRDTNVIFDGEGYINDNGYTVLPTWDAEQGCYVFSYFVMTTTGGNRGYKYDVDNDTARVTFKIRSGGSSVRDLLLDGIANHGINIVLTVTCKKDGNAVTQDYFYSDELLKECFGTTSNLTFQLGNVSSLSDVTFEIKVVSETGAYQSGGVVTLAECEQ